MGTLIKNYNIEICKQNTDLVFSRFRLHIFFFFRKLSDENLNNRYHECINLKFIVLILYSLYQKRIQKFHIDSLGKTFFLEN